MYESDPRNADSNDLHFDNDETLIARRWIYRIKNGIIFMMNNGPSVYV